MFHEKAYTKTVQYVVVFLALKKINNFIISLLSLLIFDLQ